MYDVGMTTNCLDVLVYTSRLAGWHRSTNALFVPAVVDGGLQAALEAAVNGELTERHIEEDTCKYCAE